MSQQVVRAAPQSARLKLFIRIVCNVAGAVAAAFFARASLRYYMQTHSLIGAVFLVEQMWFVVANLVRRPAIIVSRRLGDWLLGYGGTFAGVLLRPTGAHLRWGVDVGLGFQLLGLAVCLLSLAVLGRSFGLAPAYRGLAKRGPYAVVRHPLYAGYLLTQSGYLMQSWSIPNVLVSLTVVACNVGRVSAEERLLTTAGDYRSYASRVRWRLLPGVW